MSISTVCLSTSPTLPKFTCCSTESGWFTMSQGTPASLRKHNCTHERFIQTFLLLIGYLTDFLIKFVG